MTPSIKAGVDSSHVEQVFSTPTDEQTVWQALKENPKVVCYSVVSCLSAMLWGFDIGVNTITVAMPAFKIDFGYEFEGELLIAAYWNALWVAMTSAGMLLGGIGCGFVSDRFGRRSGLVIGCVLSAIGVAVEYISENAGVLLAGKIINGLALGFFLTIGPIYASEIAPLRLRSILVGTINFFISAGQLMAIGIGQDRITIFNSSSYKVMFAAQWAFPGIIILMAVVLPESPWYLVKQGKSEQAARSLRRLHNSSYNVEAKILELEVSINREEEYNQHQKSISYVRCFQGSDWRRTRIACGMFIIQQFTGIAFYSQSLYFLGISGLPILLTFQLALGGFGIALAANVASWFIMSYVGRRKLLIAGVIVNFLLLISVGFAGLSNSDGALLYIAIMMNIAQLFYAPLVGSVSWAVSAEISSGQMRAKTQSLCTITNALTSWIFQFITPYLINTDEANLGGKSAFIWAGLSLVGLVWVWFEVPETKDRSFAVLDELFARKTATRKFVDTIIGDLDLEKKEDEELEEIAQVKE